MIGTLAALTLLSALPSCGHALPGVPGVLGMTVLARNVGLLLTFIDVQCIIDGVGPESTTTLLGAGRLAGPGRRSCPSWARGIRPSMASAKAAARSTNATSLLR